MARALPYKFRQQPDDFEVEELTDVQPGDSGAFGLYRLEKRGWTTPDALAALRRRWHVPPQQMSYGGLKDRHAHTIQYLTIRHGPRRNLTHHDISVTYLGQTVAAYESSNVRANRFRIVLRDLQGADAERALAAAAELRVDGVPNYFDDQRFGSVVAGGDFIGRLLVQGRFEDALRQALAAPYEFDRGPQKHEKVILRAHWGDWTACKEKLGRSHARSLVDYLLHHPTDFRGAVARLRPELRGLYLSAYQSHLWNRILALWLRQCCRAEQLLPVTLRLGDVPMVRGLDEVQRRALEALWLPLPSARLRLDADDPRAITIDAVLREEGLVLKDLQVKGIRELFFSKGERMALCRPEGLVGEAADDERHRGRQAMTLRFDLPRGSYATLIVKRLMHDPRPPAEREDNP
jgi:tRNA pseudouridine13 synthase